jgi:hypothetical protein
MESTKSGTVFRKAIMKSRNQPVDFLRTRSAEDWFKFSQICVDQCGYSTPSKNDFTDDVLGIRGKAYLCAFRALSL